MCCECCFTTIIYNVMTIALSSCCMYIWNTQSITAQVGQGTRWRNLFSALIYKHIVVSLSKWLAPIPICSLSKIWTVYVRMKFTEVWYLDSAKQHLPLKFPDLQNLLNWSVSCRFCSQKFNLLVFLNGIVDHAGPLVQYFFKKKINLSVFLMGIADHAGLWWCTVQSDERKEKKPKATLKHRTNLAVRLRFFMVPSYLFGTALTCHFGTSMQCAQQPQGVFFVWIPCGIPYVKTTRCCK
jgi:hypothetical protein